MRRIGEQVGHLEIGHTQLVKYIAKRALLGGGEVALGLVAQDAEDVDGLARAHQVERRLFTLGRGQPELHQRGHVERGDELVESHLEVAGLIASSLLRQLLTDAVVHLLGRSSIGIGAGLLLVGGGAFGFIGGWRRFGSLVYLLLRGTLVIGALLRFAGRALALFPALFGLDHIVTQFAVAAEQAAVVDHKLGLLVFVCHISSD